MLFEIPWPKRKGPNDESGAQRQETSQSKKETVSDPREKGIIVGGEPETYPAEKPMVLEPFRDDGIVVGEERPEYSSSEKVNFLNSWKGELTELAQSIENLPSDKVFNTLDAEKAPLQIGWSKSGNVRLTWIHKTGEGETAMCEEVTDVERIAEAFPLAVLESVFDRAKGVLEYYRKREELKKGGPQPPSAE